MNISVLNYLFRIPRSMFKLFFIYYNRLAFKLSGVSFGKNMRIYNSFYLIKHPHSHMTIGDNLEFTSGGSFNPLCRNIKGCIFLSDPDSYIHIGNGVGISSACIWSKVGITIGDNVNIGGDVILMDTDAHNLNYLIRNGSVLDKQGKSLDGKTAAAAPITIENDVLIGTRTIVLKGVTIGARSIIGSGSVVTKPIPSDCIAAGNPCKVIRYIN